VSAPSPRAALDSRSAVPTRARRFEAWLVAAFVAGLAALVVAVVLGDLPIPGRTHGLRYKTIARAIPIAWLIGLLVPAGRAALPYRRTSADLPLALFLVAAALSVAFGEGHWGDVRSLFAAVGVGLVARTLFGPPERRRWLIALLGGTVALILGRELWMHPGLLPPREVGRYALVTANPNVLGFLFAMTAPLLLAAMLAARGAARPLLGLAYGAAVLGALLSYSRVAALGLGAGTLIVAASMPRTRKALWLAAVAAAAFLAMSRPDQWVALRAPGDGDRPRIMYTALQLALEHPILGIGFGINNLEEHFPARYAELYGERVFRFHAANQVIDLLVGTGIVGTALALWWAARVGRTTFWRWRSAPPGAARVLAAGGLGSCVAIALMSLAEPPLYHGKLLPLLFLVLAAVELEPCGPPKERAGLSAPRPRASALGTPAW
jgi:hypothetical protein